jgi:streptomycin 6-kinase
VDGDPGSGWTALVVPVTTDAGEPAVLKLVCPGEEEEHEHLALQRWGGEGAVRMLRADPARRALLLERLHRRDLTGLPDLNACEIVAGLYARLHVPALPQLRAQTRYIERWTNDLASLEARFDSGGRPVKGAEQALMGPSHLDRFDLLCGLRRAAQV